MNPDSRQRYAGFWRRFAATLIDSFLYSILSLLLVYLLYGPAYFQGVTDRGGRFYGLGELIINWLLPLLVTVFFWVRFLGTPGKLLMSCQVVDARSGTALSVGQALLRYVSYLVSLLPLGLGFLWIIWDKRKQGFHDKIAKTVVILEDESQKSLEELEKELR